MSDMRGLLRIPSRLMLAISTEPGEIWRRGIDKISERRERRRPQPKYPLTSDWDRCLHTQLGLAWPCAICAEFSDLWWQVIDSLTKTGLSIGPASFGPWNDGDTGFVRAVWCLTRHMQPEHVVETGVAHGLTSRFVLEAMQSNRRGHLWSIDLPPLDRGLRKQVGVAVSPDLADRWTYIAGSSRRRLPGLLSKLRQIDLFIHDSLHSERNVRFELDRAWAVLRTGGAAVIDDIDANWAFHSFNRAYPAHPRFVCEAEPLRPDGRRFNGKGLFGIILKADNRYGVGTA